MRKTGCRGPRPLRLDLCCIDSDAYGPRGGEYDGEDVYGDDDDPTASAEGSVYGVTRVEPAHQEHCDADTDSTVYGAVPAAPFVGQKQSWDSYTENDNGGNSRCEKGGLRRAKASLLEEESILK